jgi:hypothetical protein
MNKTSNSTETIEIFADDTSDDFEIAPDDTSRSDYGHADADGFRDSCTQSASKACIGEIEDDALSVIESIAPRGLRSRVLDVNCSGSMPKQLRKRGFSELIVLTSGVERSLALMSNDPDDPVFDVQVETGSREEIEQAHLKNIKRKVDLVLFLNKRFNMIGPRENRKEAIANVAKLLSKKGLIVFDLANPFHYTGHSPRMWEEHENGYQLMDGTFDSTFPRYTVHSTLISKHDGSVSKRRDEFYLPSVDELREALNEHGLTDIQVFGDYQGNPPTAWCERYIVVARKAMNSR